MQSHSPFDWTLVDTISEEGPSYSGFGQEQRSVTVRMAASQNVHFISLSKMKFQDIVISKTTTPHWWLVKVKVKEQKGLSLLDSWAPHCHRLARQDNSAGISGSTLELRCLFFHTENNRYMEVSNSILNVLSTRLAILCKTKAKNH